MHVRRAALAFTDRSGSCDPDTPETSRFSCMLFSSVHGVSDYAGPMNHSRLARLTVLPSASLIASASWSRTLFEAQYPAHRYLYLHFKCDLAITPARLKARMDSLLPFLYDSFIRDNIPVYPGVLWNRYPFLQLVEPVEGD